MIIDPITSRREAVNKLKMYWLLNDGSDYLRHLRGLRRDISSEHKSSEALDLEVEWLESVHELFIKWTETKDAMNLQNSVQTEFNHFSPM